MMRKTVDADARERLLTASLDLFTTKGYASTSVREIVAAAGVTKPVLYYYFGNKEGIYLELMGATFLRFQEIVSHISEAEGTAVQKILLFATGIYDAFLENKQVVRLIYSIFFGPPQGAPHFPHENYFNVILEVVADLIREGIAKGEFAPVDVTACTWVVVSCINTIMEEQLCQVPARIEREGLITMISLILKSMKAEELHD